MAVVNGGRGLHLAAELPDRAGTWTTGPYIQSHEASPAQAAWPIRFRTGCGETTLS